MRLVEVRAFLHSGSWFDLTEPRLGFAPGYLTHWSRLIDAPLAGLILPSPAIGGPAFGEAARAPWPLARSCLPLLYRLRRSRGDSRRAGRGLARALFSPSCASAASSCSARARSTTTTRKWHYRRSSWPEPTGATLPMGGGWRRSRCLPGPRRRTRIPRDSRRGRGGLCPTLRLDPQSGRHFGEFGLDGRGWSLLRLRRDGSPRAVANHAMRRLSPSNSCFVGIVIGGRGGWRDGTAPRDQDEPEARLLGLMLTGIAALAAYGLADPSCLKGPFGHIDRRSGRSGSAMWPRCERRPAYWRLPADALLYLVASRCGPCGAPDSFGGKPHTQGSDRRGVLIVASAIGAAHIRGLLYTNWFAVPVVGCRFGAQGRNRSKWLRLDRWPTV